MNTPTRVGGFAVGLAAVFAAAAGIGSLVGPVDSAGATESADHDTHSDTASDPAATASGEAVAADVPGGLMTSQAGYTLELSASELAAGSAAPVSFRILDAEGQVLTAYDVSHEELLHLIAVRRDMSGFQHVHPELAADGTWSAPLGLTPGDWRLFTDFDPAGDDPAVTLGRDIAVAGPYDPQPLPEPARTAEVDGYTVTLDGELVPGEESELTLSVSRDGRPVTDLQPYLAAYGHLVVLRDGDLAYLHVHPAGEPGDGRTEPGPEIAFYASVPSVGTYRLFLDFQHEGVVRTAEFTAQATDGTTPAAAPTPSGLAPTSSGPTDDGHGAGGHSD